MTRRNQPRPGSLAAMGEPLPAGDASRDGRARGRTALLLWVLCAGIMSETVCAAQFTVDSLTDTLDSMAGDGLCADAAGACSLRAAIQEANALGGADSVLLGPGIHVIERTGTLENLGASGDLDILSEIDLAGAGEQLTTIDGGSLDRVMDVHPGGALALHGLSITAGLLPQFTSPDASERAGGGLLVRTGGAAELDQVLLHGNRSLRDGGGISVYGSLRATRLRVLANVANSQNGAGGAVHIGSSASLLDLDECELRGNSAATGAGIYGDGNAAISVSRCLIADNDAGNDGGGGIAANIGSAHWLLRNLTISGNAGGGIFGDGAHQLRCEHCTITANHVNSPNGGGAIADVRGPSSPNFTAITLVNSIVHGNLQPAGNECHTVFASVIVSAGGTLRAPGNACRMSAGPGDITTADAGLEPRADNGGFSATHGLSTQSPAIDAAQSGACLPTDQRAEPRPRDGDQDGNPDCDIGAFELDVGSFGDGFENLGRRP